MMKFTKHLDYALFEADEQLPLFSYKRRFGINWARRLTKRRGGEFADILEISYVTSKGKRRYDAWRGSPKLVNQALRFWKTVGSNPDKHGRYYGWIKKNFTGPYSPEAFVGI